MIVAATAPLWLPALVAGATRLLSERYLFWVASLGLTDDAFAAAARDFAADRVVIATGCASPLAEHVCVALGLADVPVVASTLVRRGRWRWRLPRAVSARGDGKVRALMAAGIALPVEHACSDSASDLPLLRAERVPHVVDAMPRDLRRMRAVLGAGVDVLTWAEPSSRVSFSEHRVASCFENIEKD